MSKKSTPASSPPPASGIAPPAARLTGPHRSDLAVGHGPKSMPARLCSTGEQKALLVGLVLAHAELANQRRDGMTPMLLLDEIAAHLDPARRTALFDEILRLGLKPG